MKSIMQNVKYCYVCGETHNLHKHHVMKGTRNRDKAEKDGLWVYLCYDHHEGTYGVHGKLGHDLDMYLIKEAENRWINYYNKSTEEFIERYGRNYL